MEGYTNCITLEDLDVAASFADELVRHCIPFVVTHHEGLMAWRFYFQNNDFATAGEAFASVAKGTYV